MDPNLHVKQALNHLNRVLSYAPFVAEEGMATVHLTPEDWNVLADMLLYMDVPKEILPAQVQHYGMTENGRALEIHTPDCLIKVEMI